MQVNAGVVGEVGDGADIAYVIEGEDADTVIYGRGFCAENSIKNALCRALHSGDIIAHAAL